MMLGLLLLSAALPWTAPPTVPPQFLGVERSTAPQRIVTLAPGVTEFVCALGACDRLVGVSRYADAPDQVTALPKAGGFTDPNVEVIVGMKPDLVIAAANASNRPPLERLAGLGIPVLVVPGNSFADTFVAGTAIAEALGGAAPGLAQALFADIQRRTSAVLARNRERPPLKVAVVYDHSLMVLAGPGSFADTMIHLVGGQNIARSGGTYPRYSVEQVIVAQPALILDAGHRPARPEFWSRLAGVPAVESERVVRFHDAYLNRPGPRLAEVLERFEQAFWGATARPRPGR